ncbi:hypothetical protein H0E84_08080 [Luteimonas sp. SJ-92]|uniref:Uncharacterized protein n=1 Tax=Luteimonas salinisoli TaxID=2752307 RepID=A0A853JAW1_9GAMM|nr:hypothetical protein [Luteimonas salinisoli]NZA26341.1 hypothetical protein [Luteimonas salinisoli]
MALTIGFTSMDQATETALRAAFADANAELHAHFSLVPETTADYVVIDMDSMYGPMGWLRLHAAGKQVVGLTAAPRTQADFRLGRPFDTVMVIGLLREIAAKAGIDLAAEPTATETETAPPPMAEPRQPQPPPPSDAAPAPSAEEPEAGAAAASEAPGQPSPDLPESGGSTAEPAAPPSPLPLRHAAPAPTPAPALARDPVLADWLQPGALSGRRRYRRGSGPELWIDLGTREYHGPALLKPLAGYFEGTVREEDLERVDDQAWATGIAAAGDAQPLSRLVWLGGLSAGKGELLPGNDPDGRYRLTKWSQTEREYPRHFRIATAMMRGPATLAEIAEASSTPLPEVADFINANLATGFAELVPEPEPEPESPARSGGFFGRLRRKP